MREPRVGSPPVKANQNHPAAELLRSTLVTVWIQTRNPKAKSGYAKPRIPYKRATRKRLCEGSAMTSGREAELFCGFFPEAAHDLAHLEHLLGKLVEHILDAHGLVEVLRPAALVAVVVPAEAGDVEGGGPFSGEAVGDPIQALADAVGVLVVFGLVLLEPQRLGRHPLGREVGVPGVLQRRVSGFGDPSCLVYRPDVHPHDGWPQDPLLPVEGHDGAGRGVH
jgi:hypothetical protein